MHTKYLYPYTTHLHSYAHPHTHSHIHTHTHTLSLSQTTVNIVQFVDFLSSKGASKEEAMEVSETASYSHM